jgi:hypothetical protein
MIDNIKDYLLMNKQKSILFIILFIYTLFLAWFSFSDTFVWWDESVYVGMGKYIASGGHLGMWEIFRPPLLPLFYAFLFKLNIPLILLGKILVIISSVSALYLVYLISESIKKGAGIFSCIFLMITPVFFGFSRVPMTDIISIFFALLAIHFFIKEKLFLTGLFISFVFLLRFPQGLIIVPIGIVYIINSYNKSFKLWFINSFIGLSKIFLGFIILVSAYLISNYILYGNILKPFILASDAVSLSSSWYDYGLFYYVKSIYKVTPFLFLSLLFPLFYISKNYISEPRNKKNLLLILIVGLVVTSYFFIQTHKELRYSLAFIPYLAILSGVSLYFIISLFKNKKFLVIIFIVYLSYFIFTKVSYLGDDTGYKYNSINDYMSTLSGNYISTNPLPAVYGHVHVLSLFESASSFDTLYSKKLDSLDGIFIKDCDFFCSEKKQTKICSNDLEKVNKIIENSKFKKGYEEIIDQCIFSIYNK